MSDETAPAADWYPDPSGRFQFRYWDGSQWTGHVSTEGQTSWDPPAGGAEAGAQVATEPQQEPQPQPEPEPVAEPEPRPEPEPELVGQPTSDMPSEQPATATPTEQPSAATAPAREPDHEAWRPAAQTVDPADTNLAAIAAAGLGPETSEWLRQVATQVEPRLRRITPGWADSPQSEAAKACAFGLLLGHLAAKHPHMRPDLSNVAEAHPSFTTLDEGSRLDTLESIAADHGRATAWLGPLIGVEDTQRVGTLFA